MSTYLVSIILILLVYSSLELGNIHKNEQHEWDLQAGLLTQTVTDSQTSFLHDNFGMSEQPSRV